MKQAFIFILFFGWTICFAQYPGKYGDQGNGTYINPVLPADYSDIDAIRVGQDYYAISSTFQFSPGIVIIHSKDLVNWRILGHVTYNLNEIGPELNWDRMNRYGKGIWAGSIRYHNGKFWVYFCTPDEGFFMSSATNPAGPWSPLNKMWSVSGWDDCCPFWDDDGNGYLIATNFAGNYKIHLFRMSADSKELLMGSDSVIHQSEGGEANKLYEIHGLYYHYFSEVKPEGRVIMMGRSENIYGPYDYKQLIHVNKKIDKEPNQGGLIQTMAGDWWFFTHQGTGDWEGRAACLLPVTWVNGWPVIGRVGADTIGNMVWSFKMPVKNKMKVFYRTNDEFSYNKLAVQWEWNYQPRMQMWSLAERPGFLRLHAFVPVKGREKDRLLPGFYRAGNTLTQRSMRTRSCRVTIKMNIEGMADGQLAGLCHFSSGYSTFGIKQRSGIRTLVYDSDGRENEGLRITGPTIWLRSVWDYKGNSQYWFSLDGKTFHPFGTIYKLTWGFYRGDRIGIYSYNRQEEEGFIDVDWFHYKIF